jgi:hypothetical protein
MISELESQPATVKEELHKNRAESRKWKEFWRMQR